VIGNTPKRPWKRKSIPHCCGTLLRGILLKDGWTLRRISPDKSLEGEAPAEPRLARQVRDAVFLAQKNGLRIGFLFQRSTNAQTHGGISCHPAPGSQSVQTSRCPGRFDDSRNAPTQERQQRRQSSPGAFFASVEEMREVAAGGTPSVPERSGGMISFQAEVMANIQIGGSQSPLYRLVFKAPEMQDILPPQFVMMDTTPKRVPLGARAVRRGNLRGAVDLAPRPLLKRPFGICRAFLPHFAFDYTKRLRLPPTLALALHPPAAGYFDMLYKVLPNGIGTPLMATLKRGHKNRYGWSSGADPSTCAGCTRMESKKST